MHRGYGYVGQVHGNLGNAVLFDKPANGTHFLEGSRDADRLPVFVLHHFTGYGIPFPQNPARFAHVESYGVCPAHRGGIQVHIVGHQEVAGPNGSGAGSGDPVVPEGRTKIRLPFLGFHPVPESFIFARSAIGQAASFFRESGKFIAIDRNAQLPAYPAGKLSGPISGLFHGDIGYGYQRTYIGSAKPRVFPLMMAHVDQLTRFPDGPERSFHNKSRLSHECINRAVGSFSRVNIQQFNTLRLPDHFGNLLNYSGIAPLRKIGNAFDQLLHRNMIVFISKYSKSE